MQSTIFNLHLNLLQLIIRGICTDTQTISHKDGVFSRLKDYFPKLARAYHAVLEEQPREFFGLRDYYRYQDISNFNILMSFFC